MITGTHAIVYTTDAEADRAFFRDVLGFANVDAGDGWLIFTLPPAELGIHPYDSNDRHELYLLCDDVEATVKDLAGKGVETQPVSDQGFGLTTSIRLPGGGDLGLYQPKHPAPPQTDAGYTLAEWPLRASEEFMVEPHIHHTSDESFYVLAGELEVRFGNEPRRFTQGQVATVPAGTAHTFRAVTDPTRVLAVMSPRVAALIDALHEPGLTSEQRNEVWARYGSSRV